MAGQFRSSAYEWSLRTGMTEAQRQHGRFVIKGYDKDGKVIYEREGMTAQLERERRAAAYKAKVEAEALKKIERMSAGEKMKLLAELEAS